MSMNCDTTITHPDYNRRLKNAICEKFIYHFTDTTTLVRVLQKYNNEVLTPGDINFIINFEKNNGYMAANQQLLERLPAYKGWFQCLLQAVNDEHINLSSLQNDFQVIKDDLDDEILSGKDEVVTGTQSFDNGKVPPSLSQRKESQRLKITIERLTKQMNESNAAYKGLHQVVMPLKQEVSHQNKDNEKLNNQVRGIDDAHKELQQLMMSISREVVKQKRENERLTRQMKDLNDEYKELQQVVMPLKLEVSQLKKENAKQKQEVMTLKKKVSKLENDDVDENITREQKGTETYHFSKIVQKIHPNLYCGGTMHIRRKKVKVTVQKT